MIYGGIASESAVPRYLMTNDSSPPADSKISLLTAIAIVVANMVGVGVFTSLGFQVIDIPSGFPILLLWFVGGVLSFCGAVCYGELAAMMPRSGGEYHLLSESYHPLMGFLSGWISVTVGFGAPIAAAGLAFGEYMGAITGSGRGELYAAFLVILVTLVHLRGVRTASQFQVIFTSGKVFLILLLSFSAFLIGKSQGVSFLPQPGDLDLIFQPAFAISLFWVMYAYSGWNAAAYVAGEVRNPGRNVPLALVLGTGIVTVLYLMLNAAFLHVAPIEEMKFQEEVGLIAATHIFGEQGGKVMGLLISFGLVSTISSMIWAGPRVTQVMAEDYRLFGFLSVKNRFGSPGWAILLQAAIVLILLVTSTFESLIYYIQALLFVSSLLVVLAVFVLRFRRPEADRPYKTWGYPVTPAVFLAATVLMLIKFASERPSETLWGLLTLVSGFAVYYIAKRRQTKRTS